MKKIEERFYANPEGIHLAKTVYDENGNLKVDEITEENVTREVFAAICQYSDFKADESFDFADYRVIITRK